MPSPHDREILHRLASEVAELATLPEQELRRQRWRDLNGLRPQRPMVMIDQVCWNELAADELLREACEDPACRAYECQLRRILYQWRHFRVDMVIEPWIDVPMAISHNGFGIDQKEETKATDPANSVISHHFQTVLHDEADLERFRLPEIQHDAAESARRLAVAEELFAGTLRPRLNGLDPYVGVWDPVAQWLNTEDLLTELIDRPEFMLAIVDRMVAGQLHILDQLEAQRLLCRPQSLIHCTGAWCDELPGPERDDAPPSCRERWMFGLAQILGSVSPPMYELFEIEPCMPIFERFGLVYYGCCDPLHNKLAQVRRIPNVRKVSMSPWADEETGAEAIGGDLVYSRKPNPALLAGESFDETTIRRHLHRSIEICQRHGCPLELILKDLSTVRHDPSRLDRWASIAMEEVGAVQSDAHAAS